MLNKNLYRWCTNYKLIPKSHKILKIIRWKLSRCNCQRGLEVVRTFELNVMCLFQYVKSLQNQNFELLFYKKRWLTTLSKKKRWLTNKNWLRPFSQVSELLIKDVEILNKIIWYLFSQINDFIKKNKITRK